jgi:hypothetical protein
MATSSSDLSGSLAAISSLVLGLLVSRGDLSEQSLKLSKGKASEFLEVTRFTPQLV